MVQPIIASLLLLFLTAGGAQPAHDEDGQQLWYRRTEATPANAAWHRTSPGNS